MIHGIGPVLAPWAALCIAGLAVVLHGEKRCHTMLMVLGKLLAATAYLGAAIALGALNSSYGQVLLVAMGCCWFGDLLLASQRSPILFLAGLAAFLTGHLVYTAAFLIRGVSPAAMAVGLVPMLVFAFTVARWLQSHLDQGMKIPVYAYIAAICLMMITAAASFSALGGWTLVAGAALFVVSDLAVARHRFVAPGFENRAWGLPVYFLAQMLLAVSVAG